MKRIFAVMMLLLGLLTLAGCDLLGGDGNFKEVQITQEQLETELKKVDLTVATENILALTANVDIKIAVETEMPSYDDEFNQVGTEKAEVKAELKGKAGVYANLKSFEEMFVYAEVDVTYNFDLDDMEEVNLPVTEGFIKGKLYLTGGNLYLDLTMKNGGVELTIKQKQLGVFTKQQYDELLESLETGEDNQIDLSDIFEELSYKVLKSKDKYKLDFTFAKTDLEGLVDILNGLLFNGEKYAEVVENKKFDATASIIFSDALQKISLKTDLDFKLRIDVPSQAKVDISVFAKTDLTIDFKAKMPKVPAKSVLDEFPLMGLPFL